ncbi:UNVERIFIED_CONTAM: hypothetical protein PYX00_010126 [Menopon gallinae]|uniref:Uncharacterized protein n=1 Tax=Menopon gallinae TaxID=328185 RepID=A0AAW2HDT3_9NEOP
MEIGTDSPIPKVWERSAEYQMQWIPDKRLRTVYHQDSDPNCDRHLKLWTPVQRFRFKVQLGDPGEIPKRAALRSTANAT